jgi:hypothetical protein
MTEPSIQKWPELIDIEQTISLSSPLPGILRSVETIWGAPALPGEKS